MSELSSSAAPTRDAAPGPAPRAEYSGGGPAELSGAQPPSVLVLTRNEEINIEECLRSLAFSDDIVVLDSFSDDRTVELAGRFPHVRVIQRKFDTWSRHSNWALENIPFRHPWVYYSDADERVTPELRDEVLRVVNDPGPAHVAYRLRYKNMFLGRWLRRGGLYPVWIMRLFRPEKVRYEDREVNAHPVVDGTVGELREHFIHYSFSKGLAPWFQKHNSYSQMEAHEAMRVRAQRLRDHLRGLFSADKAARRRSAKNLSFYPPARGAIRFLYAYLIKRGFLDGLGGLRYALMISMYEYWIELKIREQESQWERMTDAVAQRLLDEPRSNASPRGHGRPRRCGDSANASPQSPAGAVVSPPAIDVLIPTFNEAGHVAQAVANALQVGAVFVLDSGSTDGTQELARRAGATVVAHPWEGYARQKNWGLANLPFTGEWVFILDADERFTPALSDELRAAVDGGGRADGYFVNRMMLFMGQRIRHGGLYPSWNLRFFRRGRARYEDRSVHEHMICDGPTEYLRAHLLHIRRETMSQYLNKHIIYADLESDEWVKQRLGQSSGAKAEALFRHGLRYRQWLRRRVWPWVPARPFWRFVYMYDLRLGVLDGRAGWHLAMLMANYEYMISLLYQEKLDRARRTGRPETPATSPMP
jgi:glycosyltransferase involved in cell wall biosynthesis